VRVGGDQRTSLPLGPTLISRARSGDHCSLRQAMQIHGAPPPPVRGANAVADAARELHRPRVAGHPAHPEQFHGRDGGPVRGGHHRAVRGPAKRPPEPRTGHWRAFRRPRATIGAFISQAKSAGSRSPRTRRNVVACRQRWCSKQVSASTSTTSCGSRVCSSRAVATAARSGSRRCVPARGACPGAAPAVGRARAGRAEAAPRCGPPPAVNGALGLTPWRRGGFW
jgi:hypothetical protein